MVADHRGIGDQGGINAAQGHPRSSHGHAAPASQEPGPRSPPKEVRRRRFTGMPTELEWTARAKNEDGTDGGACHPDALSGRPTRDATYRGIAPRKTFHAITNFIKPWHNN
jgi:hypothetical protein